MNYYTKAIIILLAVASTAADNNQLLEDTSTKSMTTADKILQVLKGESSLFGDTTSLVGVGVDSESTLERDKDGNRDGGRGNRGGGDGDKGRGGGGNKGGGSRPKPRPNDPRTRRPRPPSPRPPRPTRRPTRRPPTPRVSVLTSLFSFLFFVSSSLTYARYFL